MVIVLVVYAVKNYEARGVAMQWRCDEVAGSFLPWL